jgi:hypothetical protein
MSTLLAGRHRFVTFGFALSERLLISDELVCEAVG